MAEPILAFKVLKAFGNAAVQSLRAGVAEIRTGNFADAPAMVEDDSWEPSGALGALSEETEGEVSHQAANRRLSAKTSAPKSGGNSPPPPNRRTPSAMAGKNTRGGAGAEEAKGEGGRKSSEVFLRNRINRQDLRHKEMENRASKSLQEMQVGKEALPPSPDSTLTLTLTLTLTNCRRTRRHWRPRRTSSRGSYPT